MIGFWVWNLRYEGVAAMKALLAVPGGSVSSRALGLQGLAAFHVHYPTPESRAAAEESLALLQEVGDTQNAAMTRLVIAWKGQFERNFERPWNLIGQAEHELARGSEPGAWVLLHYLKALLHLAQGTFAESIPEWELALARAREIHHQVLEGAMCSHLGIALPETQVEPARPWSRCIAPSLSTSAETPSTGSRLPSFTSPTPC
jgi:hypothetical protein